MNIFNHFLDHLHAVIKDLQADGTLPDALQLGGVQVEPPRDPSHGDLASNAALVLAKQAKMKPRDLAEKLAGSLAAINGVQAVEIAGPGFLNLRLDADIWQAVVSAALKAGNSFGDTNLGQGVKVNVEYVSANPTGPMHVGHCRGAVFGDALAALLEKAGHEVHREYYINDAGSQIDTLARSAFLRYREACGEEIGAIPEGLYPGDYLKPVGAALKAAHGEGLLAKDEADWLPLVKDFAIDAMMGLIRQDLKVLGITHETFFSERRLHEDGLIDAALQALVDKGLIYEGVLEPPKGKLPDDWEARPQTLFKASEFGDDTDRALKKSDGAYTYFAADIAYHYDKFRRGYTEMIDILGADHGGYVKRMKAATTAISGGAAHLDIKLVQMVSLFRNGEPVAMSKRAGTFVTLRDVVDEVGKDVTRFIMLFRKNDAALEFDFAKVLEQSKDNPVFYVQYAHARVCSVLRNAAEALPGADLSDAALADADLSPLTDEAELHVAQLIGAFPRLVEQAATAHEPHRVAFYLYDLATAFHQLWNKGKDDAGLRFILIGDEELAPEAAKRVTMARLALIRGVAVTLAAGLSVLGVEPVSEMR